MKSVLLSINPKWCELIANGEKTIEVRKTRPKCDTPFKCYIYCTLSELLTRSHYNGEIYIATSKKHQEALERNGNTTLSGKVIAEFVCDSIFMMWDGYAGNQGDDCLTFEEREKYLQGNNGYGWHISDLMIYDKPKELKDFFKHDNSYDNAFGWVFKDRLRRTPLKRPPQSWCYVEENNNDD